jgi:Lon protease-like protein
MTAFQPSPEQLPAEIGIFPLPGALLLPHGRLPLNIFEPRYLALISDAMGNGRMFGMIQPDPSQPQGAGVPAVYRTGCVGRLASFAETDDGRFLITLAGVLRFRIAEELPMRAGYRRVRADYAGFLEDLAEPDEHPVSLDRRALTAALKPYFRAHQIDANWDAIEQTPDAMLVTTLCMVCPFDVREKQALLEAATPEARAEMLVALLQMGAAGGAPAEGRPS